MPVMMSWKVKRRVYKRMAEVHGTKSKRGRALIIELLLLVLSFVPVKNIYTVAGDLSCGNELHDSSLNNSCWTDILQEETLQRRQPLLLQRAPEARYTVQTP